MARKGKRHLTNEQHIAVRMIAAGYRQSEVAHRLRKHLNTVANWVKEHQEFRAELKQTIVRRDELFDEELKAMVSVVSWRLRDILLNGTDTNALKAIDMMLRVRGKYQDKLLIEEQDNMAKDADEHFNEIEQHHETETRAS